MKGIAAAATPNIVTTATDAAADTDVHGKRCRRSTRKYPSPLPKKTKAREYQTVTHDDACSTQQRKPHHGIAAPIGLCWWEGGGRCTGPFRGSAGFARRGQPEAAMSTLRVDGIDR